MSLLLFLTCLTTTAGALAGDPAVVERLPPGVSVLGVFEMEGEILLGTSDGVWQVSGDRLRLVGGKGLSVFWIKKACGAYWISTPKGFFAIRGGRVQEQFARNDLVVWRERAACLTDVARVCPAVCAPSSAAEVRALEDPWFDRTPEWSLPSRRQSGRYSMQTLQTLLPSGAAINRSRAIGNALWLATRRGVFAILPDGVRKRFLPQLSCYDMRVDGEVVWVVARDGLHRLVLGRHSHYAWPLDDYGDDILSDKELDGSDKSFHRWITLELIQGEPWIFPPYGSALRLVEEKLVEVEGVEGQPQLAESAGVAWLLPTGQRGNLVRVERPAITVVAEELETLVTKPTDDALWLGTTDGAWRLRGNEARQFAEAQHVHLLEPLPSGEIWIGSEDGASRIARDAETAATPDDEVHFVVPHGKTVWIGTNAGVYRVDGGTTRRVLGFEDGVLDLRPAGANIWALDSSGDLFALDDAGGRTALTTHVEGAHRRQFSLEGSVERVSKSREDSTSVCLDLALDLRFTNRGTSPLLLLRPELQSFGGPFWLGWKSLALTPEDADAGRFVYGDGGWNSYEGATRWAERRARLDVPHPPLDMFLVVPPAGAWGYSTTTRVCLDKRSRDDRVATLDIARRTDWPAIQKAPRLWLEVELEVWPIDLDLPFRRDLSPACYFDCVRNRFGPMLRRRWREDGTLLLGHATSRPIPLDLGDLLKATDGSAPAQVNP